MEGEGVDDGKSGDSADQYEGDMDKNLIAANKIDHCPGFDPDRNGFDIEAIVHSFEDGSTEVFCTYFDRPIREVKGEPMRCMREYHEEKQDRQTEKGKRCIWKSYSDK
jgi:hypothetical protein